MLKCSQGEVKACICAWLSCNITSYTPEKPFWCKMWLRAISCVWIGFAYFCSVLCFCVLMRLFCWSDARYVSVSCLCQDGGRWCQDNHCVMPFIMFFHNAPISLYTKLTSHYRFIMLDTVLAWSANTNYYCVYQNLWTEWISLRTDLMTLWCCDVVTPHHLATMTGYWTVSQKRWCRLMSPLRQNSLPCSQGKDFTGWGGGEELACGWSPVATLHDPVSHMHANMQLMPVGVLAVRWWCSRLVNERHGFEPLQSSFVLSVTLLSIFTGCFRWIGILPAWFWTLSTYTYSHCYSDRLPYQCANIIVELFASAAVRGSKALL